MTSLRVLPMINVTPSADDLAVVPDLTVIPDLAVVRDHDVVAPSPASRRVMALLAGGVPLSLLCDLADPAGPPSADIASSESDSRSLLGDLLSFRSQAAEGSGAGARARAALRNLR